MRALSTVDFLAASFAVLAIGAIALRALVLVRVGRPTTVAHAWWIVYLLSLAGFIELVAHG